MKLVVNHITFNPSASRFLFLLRNFPEEGKRWGIYFFDDEIGQRQLLEDELVNRFSPDGKRVTFDFWHSGRREILLFPFDKETILQKR